MFQGAGLTDVATDAIDIDTAFVDFEEYWKPFLGGNGPAPAYAMSLDESDRIRLRERIREKLPIQADGSLLLTARMGRARHRGQVIRHPKSIDQRESASCLLLC